MSLTLKEDIKLKQDILKFNSLQSAFKSHINFRKLPPQNRIEIEEELNKLPLNPESITLYITEKLPLEYKKVIARSNENLRKKVMKEAMNQFNDILDMAERFTIMQPISYDHSKIWWLWNHLEYKWEMVDETDLYNAISQSLSSPYFTIKNQVKNEIIESLKRLGRMRMPKQSINSWVQFKNIVIDLKNDKAFEPTPEYFMTNPIPWEIGDSEETPIMDKIFEEWVGKDKVKILYQIIAYCCLPDYPIHRIFCFIGAGMNGKSKYLQLIKKFVGSPNICSTELDTLMSGRFETCKLYKKLVCFMGEVEFIGFKRTAKLKMLSGGDAIGFEFKNKLPFDDVNYAKLLIATNNLPPTQDKTKGFYRRWTLIDFSNEFSEKKDVLSQIPDIEYNNLAKKCVRILKELLNNREFHNEESIEVKRQRYEDKSDPLQKFLNEKTIMDSEGYIFKFEFNAVFQGWLKQNGYRIWNNHEISNYMSSHFEVKQKGEKNYRAYVCLRWKGLLDDFGKN